MEKKLSSKLFTHSFSRKALERIAAVLKRHFTCTNDDTVGHVLLFRKEERSS